MRFCGMRVVLALFFLSWVVSSKFSGWVVSDLVGWLFRPIFRVSVILAFGRFGQSLEVIMYELMCKDGQMDRC